MQRATPLSRLTVPDARELPPAPRVRPPVPRLQQILHRTGRAPFPRERLRRRFRHRLGVLPPLPESPSPSRVSRRNRDNRPRQSLAISFLASSAAAVAGPQAQPRPVATSAPPNAAFAPALTLPVAPQRPAPLRGPLFPPKNKPCLILTSSAGGHTLASSAQAATRPH